MAAAVASSARETRSKTGNSKPRVFETISAPTPAARKKAGAPKKKTAAATKPKKAPAVKKESKPKIKKTVAGKVTKAKKDVKKAVNGATKKTKAKTETK